MMAACSCPHSASCAPGSVPDARSAWASTPHLGGKYCCSQVSGEDTEAQRGEATRAHSLSEQAAEGRGTDKDQLRLCKEAVSGRDYEPASYQQCVLGQVSSAF